MPPSQVLRARARKKERMKKRVIQIQIQKKSVGVKRNSLDLIKDRLILHTFKHGLHDSSINFMQKLPHTTLPSVFSIWSLSCITSDAESLDSFSRFSW
jgi:hypothetical protein